MRGTQTGGRSFVLNSSTIQIYDVTTPVTNGYIATCLTLSNIETNSFIFRINYANSPAWSANIDNFEIAFDYTEPPLPAFHFPWAGEKQWKYTAGPHDWPAGSASKSGIDFAPGETHDVLAMATGTVAYVREDSWPCPPELAAYNHGKNKNVRIDHAGGWQTWYLHLSEFAPLSIGAEVTAGDYLGKVGNTGCSSGPHTHVELVRESVAAACHVIPPTSGCVHTSWDGVDIDGWIIHISCAGYSGVEACCDDDSNTVQPVCGGEPPDHLRGYISNPTGSQWLPSEEHLISSGNANNSGPPGNTPPGLAVTVIPAPSAQITFTNVQTTGSTSVTQDSNGPPNPTGWSLGSSIEPYIWVETTAEIIDSITSCFEYSPFGIVGLPHVLHWNSSSWDDVTSSVDESSHTICGITSSLSPFVIAEADSDNDEVANATDNCPLWPNPRQSLPSWPVPVDDSECDGFPDTAADSGKAPETYIGTDAAKHCAMTATANDESGPDAMPPDFNDDQIINGQDTGKYGGPFGSFNKLVSTGPFGPPGQELPGERFNFNGDTVINGQDTGKYQFYYNKTCA
jgi:hypothetical protein